MKLKVAAAALLILSVFSAFAERNDILYSYEFNRFKSGRADIALSAGASYCGKNFKFRNLETKDIDSDDKTSLGIDVDLTERFNRFSVYETVGTTKTKPTLGGKKTEVLTVSAKIGITKDFLWTAGSQPFTINAGAALAARIDSLKKNDTYNSAAYLGFAGRLQLNWHFSQRTGMLSVFARYEPEFYILTNAASMKKKLSLNSEHFAFQNTVTAGVQLNLISLTNAINSKKADRLMNNITNR